MEERQTLAPGTAVYGIDGEQIGTIQSTENAYLLVENGVQIPLSAISMSRDGEVHLSVTKSDVLTQRWTDQPGVQVAPDRVLEPDSHYTAVQGEDSLEEDPMPTPGQEPSSAPQAQPSRASGNLERPSGMTGPIDDGCA